RVDEDSSLATVAVGAKGGGGRLGAALVRQQRDRQRPVGLLNDHRHLDRTAVATVRDVAVGMRREVADPGALDARTTGEDVDAGELPEVEVEGDDAEAQRRGQI